MATGAPAAATAPTPGQRVEPKLASFALKESHSYELICDLVLDLTDPELSASLPLPDVHFRGQWTCGVERAGEDVKIDFSHGTLPIGGLGAAACELVVSAQLATGDKVLSTVSWAHSWIPSTSEDSNLAYSGFSTTVRKKHLDKLCAEVTGSLDLSSQRLYKVIFRMKPAAAICESQSDTLLHRLPNVELMHSPHDVRFFFPRAPEGGAELWANTHFLFTLPQTLFASDFAESIVVSRKRARSDGDQDGETEHDDGSDAAFSDSDDEADQALFAKHAPELQQIDDTSNLQYKQIKVTKTAFSTYRAVLAYLRTGAITFAPLSSNCRPSSLKGDFTALQFRTCLTDSAFPRPVSPKSTFRLAHLLELPALQQECLRHLSAVLCAENAPQELISSTAKLHDEWRKVILDYIVENWDEVVKAGSLSFVEGKFKRGEIEEAGPALLELYQRKLATKSK